MTRTAATTVAATVAAVVMIACITASIEFPKFGGGTTPKSTKLRMVAAFIVLLAHDAFIIGIAVLLVILFHQWVTRGPRLTLVVLLLNTMFFTMAVPTFMSGMCPLTIMFNRLMHAPRCMPYVHPFQRLVGMTIPLQPEQIGGINPCPDNTYRWMQSKRIIVVVLLAANIWVAARLCSRCV